MQYTISCLCVELLLKTKLIQIDPTSVLLEGHDLINIFKAVHAKYNSANDLSYAVRDCRKYFNESRYPASGTKVYSKAFSEQFLKHVENVKYYIDNECTATIADLKDKYRKT